MITGIVNHGLPVVQLTVRGSAGQSASIDFLVDTGFFGFLTLPSAIINRLSLRRTTRVRLNTADGSTITAYQYTAVVNWDGASVAVLVVELDSLPLLGVELMDGYKFEIEMRDGGAVTITRLP